MTQRNIRLALDTLRAARGRSLLTMFGIIVGVMAVIVTIAIGQGVKNQIAGQLDQLSHDVLVIRPGVESSALSANGTFGNLAGSTFTVSDVEVVQQTPHVKRTVPLALAPGFAEVNGQRLTGGTVIATTSELPDVLKRTIQFGTFFSDGEMNRNVAVVGSSVAQELFGENVPIGRTLTIRGQDYIVRGVFEGFATAPGSVGVDLNRAVFIPLSIQVGTEEDNMPIAQILAQTETPDVQQAAQTITTRLTAAHGGQQDFAVLDRQQELAANDQLISLLTQMIVAIAGITLIVGGIGIVNIMFVSVTERTREIGIRKAVGATNRQIRRQFLIEAITLSVVGGVIGVILSLAAIFLLTVTTTLQPVVPLTAIGCIFVITFAIGVVFGVGPAISAARKEPIEALRYE